ncbi:MAG: ABC transporter permease [Oribacterium sp.]|nr:ABC transporter permease [Oribacterium sp.]
MKKYIFKRLLTLFPVLLGVTFLTFFLLSFAPSDPVTMKYLSMGTSGDAEVMEAQREELGLNDPLLVRYGHWLIDASHGDFGESVSFGHSVKQEMMRRLPKTITLTLLSVLLTIIVTIPLGMLSAVYKNRIADYIIRFLSFVGVSMPSFWLGLLLIYVFSIKLELLPSMSGNSAVGLILPTITLAAWMIATYIRRLRANILEEINKDYVTGLLSRGIPFWKVNLKHVLPNALLTIITMFGMSIGSVLGGATVVETVFGYQGVGKMAADAVTGRDYNLMQAYVVWMAVIYVLVNLAVDILYRYLDPRIRLGEE